LNHFDQFSVFKEDQISAQTVFTEFKFSAAHHPQDDGQGLLVPNEKHLVSGHFPLSPLSPARSI